MSIVSVDLAYRHYRDIGVAVMHEKSNFIDANLERIPLSGQPTPDQLAEYFVDLADGSGSKYILIDGPQGWKDPDNGLIHSRVCERVLNTPAKTGLPNIVKPANYQPFVAFSISVFDELARLGWSRLKSTSQEATQIVIETFPLSAWRSLSLLPLPAKAKCTQVMLQDRRTALETVYPLRFSGQPTHDELQAVVAGLAGLAVESRRTAEYSTSGVAPFMLHAAHREGFILSPLRRSHGAAAQSTTLT